MLKPLQQYYCDTCGELIESLDKGWFEWLKEKKNGKYINHSFRICHHVNKCQSYLKNVNSCEISLSDFEQENRIAILLNLIDPGEYLLPDEYYKGSQIEDYRKFLEIFKRLTIPYYEQARIFLKEANRNGQLEGVNQIVMLRESYLKNIIKEYKVQ